MSRKDLQRALKALPKLPIYFQWAEGKVGTIYAAEEDSTLAINIKKGIISLFQLVNVNKQRTEVGSNLFVDKAYMIPKTFLLPSDIICFQRPFLNILLNVSMKHV